MIDYGQSVVVSSDLNPNYYFFLPIVTALWTSRIGFDVELLAVGEESEWGCGRAAVALRRARELGSRVRFVQSAGGYRTSTVAQVSRLFGFLGQPGDRYVLTSDADMWPLDRAWLNQRAGDFTVLYANAYGGQRWPICYLGAAASAWREVMRPAADDVSRAAAALLDDGLGRGASPDASWNFDENAFARRFLAWSRFSRAGLIPREQSRGIAGRRIDRADTDRSDWRPPASIDGLIDAHVGRPGWSDANWSRYYPVLAAALGPAAATDLAAYRAEFLAT